MMVLVYGFLLYHLTIKKTSYVCIFAVPLIWEVSLPTIFQHSKKIKTGLFGSTFHKNYSSLKVATFLGHLIEKADASKFQIFDIQVFAFNYRRISINQMFENLGFLRFKEELNILTTPVFYRRSFSPDVMIQF